MSHFALAVAVFILTHLIPAIPGLRDRLIARLGKSSYIALYSLVSVVTLVWVIGAALHAPVVLLWETAGWQAWVTVIVSPVALFLIVAGLISANPLSLGLFPGEGGDKGAIVLVTRHPVFWGALLWALSHIPPNGDVRSLLLFSILALLAASGFWLGDRRARKRLGPQWPAFANETSIIPFAATLAGRNRLRIDVPIMLAFGMAGVLTWWLLAGGHGVLFGADPLAATHY